MIKICLYCHHVLKREELYYQKRVFRQKIIFDNTPTEWVVVEKLFKTLRTLRKTNKYPLRRKTFQRDLQHMQKSGLLKIQVFKGGPNGMTTKIRRLQEWDF